MSRFDKYDGKDGGFRALLNAAFSTLDTVRGVSLNASGRVVIGSGGQSGTVGVICTGSAKAAGDVIDVMTDGEIIDVPGLDAGTVYFVDATTGALTNDDNTGANTRVGHTVEADRLIVRLGRA